MVSSNRFQCSIVFEFASENNLTAKRKRSSQIHLLDNPAATGGLNIATTQSKMEESIPKRRQEDGPKAKRIKSGFLYEEKAPCEILSDCYQYRSSSATTSDDSSSSLPLLDESWLTDLEPFVVDHNVDSDVDRDMHEDLVPPTLDQEIILSRKRHIKQLRQQLIQYKERMEDFSAKDFRQARRFCNPYEALDDANLFLNRSALKLANIDALLDFRLSRQLLPGESTVGSTYFVDLCGAPGGFGEYLVWRGATRGYGMSLVGRNESGRGLNWNREILKLQYNGCRTCYEIHNGFDGTGDVQNWENVLSLHQRIQESNTSVKDGAQIVLADGGVDAQRNVDDQELITTKLFVCQAAAALFLLQTGGVFLIKGFGFQSPTTRAIMAFLSRTFEAVSVIKPITSRPASAERYIIAEGYNGAHIDGPRWISQMLLARHDDIPPEISAFLDVKDEALLILNAKACADILCRMQHIEDDSNDEDEEACPISLISFKSRWQLL